MQNSRSLYKQKLLTIVSLLMLMLLCACEKNDELPPTVTIQSPTGGSYSVMDTISVEAIISDNESVKSVVIRLIDPNNQQVSPAYTYSPNTPSYQLKALYIIDNLYLESGEYYIVVEASDGVNTKKQYVSIYVGALPRVLEDILIVEKGSQETNIYSIVGEKELLKTFPYTYQDFVYNSYAEQYLFLTTEGVLIAYDKENIEEQWRVNDLKDPLHEFYGSLLYKDKLVYASSYQGGIKAYDARGNVIKQANTIDTYGQIRDFHFEHDKIMVIKEPFVNGEDRVEELNEATGSSVMTYEIPFSPKRLLFIDPELCVVFGNQYNKAKVCSLSTLYNLVHPFGNLGDRELGDAYRYSQYYYLLSLDQQVVQYDISNGNERIIDDTQSIVSFFYEELYDKIYYLDGDEISVLRYPAIGHQGFYQNDKAIDDLIFVYNK